MHEMSIREIQVATKELLKSFDTLCAKLNLQYWLMFGSLLGAVRHKGFIPWDDDLDVGMFHEDYKKLCDYLIQNESEFELHNQDTQINCFYNISRVCDKKHKLVFNNRDYTSGIFLDIYDFEGLGGEQDIAYWDKRFSNYNSWRKGIDLCTKNTLFYGNSLVHKVLNIPLLLCAKLLGKNYFIKKFNNYKHFNLTTSIYVGIPCWEEVRYRKSLFGSFIKVPFEDIVVAIPEQYDTLLSIMYGDYMQLPPKDNRVPNHHYRAYRL